jgi:phosphate-selective porin OprO and OprP
LNAAARLEAGQTSETLPAAVLTIAALLQPVRAFLSAVTTDPTDSFVIIRKVRGEPAVATRRTALLLRLSAGCTAAAIGLGGIEAIAQLPAPQGVAIVGQDSQPDSGAAPEFRLDDLARRIEAVEAENQSLKSEIAKLKKPDEKPKPDPLAMTGKWKNGLEVESADKKFRVHIGGRTQFDGVWIQDTENLAGAGGALDEDGVAFRRARLRADGTLYEFIDYAAEFDFVNTVNDNVGLQPAGEANVINVPAPTDLWFDLKHVPLVGHVRIGNMKEPIGMEHMTSSRYLEFLERSYNQDAFTGAFNNGFTPGIMLHNRFDDERGTWATGVYKNTVNVFGYNAGDGEYAWTSRATYLLWTENDDRELVHVGIAGSIRQPDQNRARYRTRMSVRNGPGALNPVVADTGFFETTQQNFLGGELASNLGPLSLQAEYIGAWNLDSVGNFRAFNGVPLGTTFVYGWYAEALYFLTGEHRPYDHHSGAFTRIVPNENFDWHGGPGAWQIGARYSQLNLDRDGLLGGVVDDVTLGLNWFLNPNLKLQWNYVCTFRDSFRHDVDGRIHGFGMRLAHDF